MPHVTTVTADWTDSQTDSSVHCESAAYIRLDDKCALTASCNRWQYDYPGFIAKYDHGFQHKDTYAHSLCMINVGVIDIDKVQSRFINMIDIKGTATEKRESNYIMHVWLS